VGHVAQAEAPVTERQKPLLRGWSHELAAMAMVVVGTLIGLSANGAKAELCVAVACFSVAAMLTTSALFHRVNWSPKARRRMRRADHSAIFVCIAGTYTAVAGLSLPDTDAWIILGIVWAACIVGIVMRFTWLDAPKWAVALPYVAVGWIAVGAVPEFFHYLGGLGFALMLGGGLLYTIGAVVYARRRPDPWPRVFGYHEIFHAFVVAAVVLHLSLIAFVLLPAANA
jgi:hemolysin III